MELSKEKKLKRLLNEIVFPEKNFETIRVKNRYRFPKKQLPISLELIIAALVKLGYDMEITSTYIIVSGMNADFFVKDISFSPLHPLPEESIDKLLTIFESK